VRAGAGDAAAPAAWRLSGAALAWPLAGFLACLAVWALNRGPLFYFDTGGYLAQGDAMLRALGLLAPPPDAGSALAPGLASAAAAVRDGTVVGSRSAVYALLLAGLDHSVGIEAAIPLQALALLAALWLPVRIAARRFPGAAPPAAPPATPPAMVAGQALLAACLGAAPFYAAYLMPDIFAPVMILALATLAVFGPAMRVWEILLALALGGLSVTMHPSHLAIAVLMVPAALLVLLAVWPRRGWLGLLLAAVVALTGLAERFAFAAAVETVGKAEVTFLPFLTARLIVDGPGLAWLAGACPEAGLATCDLYARLRDDPRRITPTNILYEKDPALGSYALMDPGTRRRIAAEQAAFARRVVLSRPFGVAAAVLRNSFVQLLKVDVHMTLPGPETRDQVAAIAGRAPASFAGIRFTGTPAWLAPLTLFHLALYAGSALALAGLVLHPRSGVPASLRGFAALILLGILANAAVCGALSQPADRYGARVALLLPAAAMLLAGFAFRRRRTPA
jgi:hypothetical protein